MAGFVCELFVCHADPIVVDLVIVPFYSGEMYIQSKDLGDVLKCPDVAVLNIPGIKLLIIAKHCLMAQRCSLVVLGRAGQCQTRTAYHKQTDNQ